MSYNKKIFVGNEEGKTEMRYLGSMGEMSREATMDEWNIENILTMVSDMQNKIDELEQKIKEEESKPEMVLLKVDGEKISEKLKTEISRICNEVGFNLSPPPKEIEK